jgi:Zn2+/Cd2+-exporting ATPase
MSQPNPNTTNPNTTNPNELKYLIAGMDCADCARKIEGVVNKTPGASNPKVNFTAEKLSLNLDESITPRAELERRITAIGYKPTLAVGYGPVVENDHSSHSDHDDHAGHDHAGHEGHDHSSHDDHEDHSGHDHSKHESEIAAAPGFDPHAGHDHAADIKELDEKAWWQTRSGRLVVISAAVFLFAFLISLVNHDLGRYAYIAATLVNLYPVATRAWAGVQYGNPLGINTLATIAALGALGIGEVAEAAVVLVLFNIGELMESIAAGKARSGIKALAKLTPKNAFVIQDGNTTEVTAEGLKVGQTVLIKPGARVPCDGTIQKGSSALDDSPVTGESMPVNKTVGEAVFAGSINTDGVLEVRVDKPASDNTIARIIQLVSEAEEGKGNTARFIDRFSRYWTPGVLAVSILVAILPPLLAAGDWHTWLYKGISILLIGCPCALLLSVPAAITSGLSTGARRGILVKGGQVLEIIGGVSRVAFDKTGTLTAGKPKVTDVMAFGILEPELLRIATAVENTSSHPLALAIVQHASSLGIQAPAVTDASAIQGKAAIATLEGRTFAVGSPKYAASLTTLAAEVKTQIETLETNGKTVVILLENTAGSNANVLGLIAIRDEPRSDSKAGIAALTSMGVKTVMLTGDNARTGNAIAKDLGISICAELLPEDKLNLIDQFRREGKIAMVGDGINDAPALAKADVGIAMGGGSDVALETANAALLRNSVMGVAELIELSRVTMGNVKQNIVFALGLKLIFLVTTLLGVSSLWMAILADTGATVIVTINAMRLLAFKSKFSRPA